MFANKNWAYLILMIIAFSRVSFGFSMYILRLSYHMFFDKIFLTHVEVRVTTKKWDLKLGILHKGFGEACESKNQKKLKNFTPTQNAKFWYLWNGSLKFPQNLHQVGYPKKNLCEQWFGLTFRVLPIIPGSSAWETCLIPYVFLNRVRQRGGWFCSIKILPLRVPKVGVV